MDVSQQAGALFRCVTDRAMRIVEVSDGLSELLHMPEKDLLGQDAMAITHHADRPINVDRLDALLESGRPFSIVKRYVRADGAPIWVRNHVSTGHDERGTPMLVATIERLADEGDGTIEPDVRTAERVVRLRQMRSTLFARDFATEPVLDMMLVLFARQERGLKSTVGTMCTAANQSYATAHRRFNDLIGSGMATTAFDPEDKRLVIVCLTPAGRSRVEAFLRSVRKLDCDA